MADLQWSGYYRIEGFHIANSEMDKRAREKTYGMHHLVLTPKIVAADGLTIHTRFDIFNYDRYPNSALGQVWGLGVDSIGKDDANAGADASKFYSRNQRFGDVRVNLLYLTYDHEFGSLIVGRAPLQFGLGMNLNAGLGSFDHFLENRDLIGYKIVMGNLMIFPMIAKIDEGGFGSPANDITEFIAQFQFLSPDSGLELSGYYMDRTAGVESTINDTPAGTGFIPFDNATPVAGRAANTKQYGVFFQKDSETFRGGFELGVINGSTAYQDGSGRRINVSSYGIATEVEWKPMGSKWSILGKLGYASGDDPNTSDYEGYIFNRNYDVAFLMFNHPLGRGDFMRTGMIGGHPARTNSPGATPRTASDEPDIEAISNVLYLAPQIQYKWNDRWSLMGTLAAGYLNENFQANISNDKSLGFEFDFAVHFRPNERVTWINQVGLLTPGNAFRGGSNNFDTNFVYGFASRAAISF